jgi:hypothetical protein
MPGKRVFSRRENKYRHLPASPEPQSLCCYRFYSLEKYMAKKCGNCGAPAPDSNSRFCDLCGAPLKEEPVTPQGLPICPACGAIVSDKKAQFCDVCGAPLAKPVCPVCGNPAPSTHSRFCTRCGATYVPGVPVKHRAAPAAAPEPEPVVLRSKKGRLPAPEDPVEEWDPWTDGDPTYDVAVPLPQPPQQKQYTDLQRVADEMARSAPAAPAQYQAAPYREPEMVQMSEPRKKYSHLPLIADELKADLDRRAADPADTMDGGRPAQAKRGKKKGMFGFK